MKNDLINAIRILKIGGVILYPTDTVWGLGCDATNESAVERILTIKKRRVGQSMLVLMENPIMLEQYVEEVPPLAWDLIEMADKPLTIIYPRAKNLAENLLPDDGSIGIRFTREAFSRQLINRFRKPLVSTSANISGQPSPALFRDIPDVIKNCVDYTVKYRQEETSPAKPSAIIRLGIRGEIEIIRQ